MHVKKIISNQLFRYIVAGGLSYALELTLILSLHEFLNLSNTTSTALAFWAGLLTSFVLQKLFAFNDFNREIKAISRQLSGYLALVLVNYAFTLLVVALFPENLLLFSRTLALAIVTMWNYLVYKKLFRKNI